MPIKNPYFQMNQSQEEEKLQEDDSQRIQTKVSQTNSDLGILRKPYFSYLDVAKERAAIDAIKQSDQTDFQEISTQVLKLSNEHYTSVRLKSEKSFSWTIIAYVVALLFFLAATTFFIIHQTNAPYITVLGTALSGLFGGLFQTQGIRVDKEAKECRANLDRIQRFIIANSACEGLDDPEKKQKRAEIISKLAE